MSNSPEWVEQYINAGYTKAEGLVFKEFDPAYHLVKSDLLPRRYNNIVVGIDWGYSHNGSAVVLGETPQGNYVVIAEHVHKGMIVDRDGWFKVFEQIRVDHRPDAWFCDPAQPAYIAAMRSYFKQKELVYEANNRRIPGIQKVKSLFYQKRLYVLDQCTSLINELQTWKFAPDKEDGIKLDDDCVDSLRYAVVGMCDLSSKAGDLS
jgi:phage terminase large subunit